MSIRWFGSLIIQGQGLGAQMSDGGHAEDATCVPLDSRCVCNRCGRGKVSAWPVATMRLGARASRAGRCLHVLRIITAWRFWVIFRRAATVNRPAGLTNRHACVFGQQEAFLRSRVLASTNKANAAILQNRYLEWDKDARRNPEGTLQRPCETSRTWGQTRQYAFCCNPIACDSRNLAITSKSP
jgi:hypothetical protein